MTLGEKLTDLSYLKEMSGNDYSIIKEMIDIFIEQVPEFLDEVSNSFESQDWQALGAVAHKAKSSVRTMGMEKTGSYLEQLEHFSKGNLKFDLQIKKEKGIEFSPSDEKNWINVKYETKNDIELKHIPELVEGFLTQCPLAIRELKETLEQH
ncbi:Hpt domain-containing protein [Labilibaculum sp. DW002]|jgi:HPt (histidine-containing phosphotransfer) domain-containing protein|uniref:Hpt domain-containing protein n=1 Tax=Paralabilibaculum antarcticum TaxID=2912572 RepID=A0ABT5VYZ1_9BACT|nr:Hpt domain-containing protein [Labilibaculum sp. DW002]MDE5419519.1 Hpt domain-containing protein [Labilibaculum sp. DW002]|eukprot:TRINITY_DN12139_c0_g1_i1.p2 TRINITY_DN12139_c0_g1~~TRINITY_DN12139_c0_g1_i1.p2  ORF type:complete len:152 (+),score=28.35 TRINITY_DN12139_c0_g1_i1:117-572(+)